MKHRSLLAVLLLGLLTCGLYYILWAVLTKDEMNERGEEVPSALWLLVPIVSWWWLWRYSRAVAAVTRGNLSAAAAFLVLALFGVIGILIVQSCFNRVEGPVRPVLPPARLV